jgi:hypothetical protein
MITRLTQQALSLSLAAVVTLAMLGSIDNLASHTSPDALLARAAAASAPAQG